MPTPLRHFKDEIQDLLDNRLDAPMRAEVERHLESCAECRREFEALRWTKLFAAKQFTAKEAPSELRQNILRTLKAEAGSPKAITPGPGFRTQKLKPILAWAAALVALGILALILIPKQPNLFEVIARDFRDFQSQKLTLELNTGNVKQMEAFFATHGVSFNTRVFDLGMMNYRLVGGRVQYFRGQPAALFVYRGPDHQVLICRMYVGTVSEMPAGYVERENRGIKFRVYQVKDVTMVFWQEGRVVCVLSSDIPSENVVQLAFAKAMLPGPPL
jgi:anti-sigma factor RsiW